MRGFTYVALLLAVAIAGALLAATGLLWRTEGVRERERELLFAGGEFARALESFHQASPQLPNRYPKSLEELLEDRRGPVVRRHLRRLYVDPFTGRSDWAVVRAPDGTIVGVHTVHDGVPFKRGERFRAFAFGEAKSYRQWVFRPRSDAEQAADPRGRTPSSPAAMPAAVTGAGAGEAGKGAASQTMTTNPPAEKP